MGIEKVLLCGLGAVGVTYADKLRDVCSLKILANPERISGYKKSPPTLNGRTMLLEYITPDEKWNPDLIVISTKAQGLDSVIHEIKNFVGDNTIIISLINGVSSERIIAKTYGWDKVLHSYFIGHSAMRENNNVTQDGVGKIVFGSPYERNQIKVRMLKEFFEAGHINYEIPEDIIYSMWLKYTLNVFSNQASAIMNLTFGDMKGVKFKNFAKKVIVEVEAVARKEGVEGCENLQKDSLAALMRMLNSGKTSMHQDILAGRKTEVDIFAGEIMRLGRKYNIQTPYNQVMYDMIKVLEGD